MYIANVRRRVKEPEKYSPVKRQSVSGVGLPVPVHQSRPTVEKAHRRQPQSILLLLVVAVAEPAVQLDISTSVSWWDPHIHNHIRIHRTSQPHRHTTYTLIPQTHHRSLRIGQGTNKEQTILWARREKETRFDAPPAALRASKKVTRLTTLQRVRNTSFIARDLCELTVQGIYKKPVPAARSQICPTPPNPIQRMSNKVYSHPTTKHK